MDTPSVTDARGGCLPVYQLPVPVVVLLLQQCKLEMGPTAFAQA